MTDSWRAVPLAAGRAPCHERKPKLLTTVTRDRCYQRRVSALSSVIAPKGVAFQVYLEADDGGRTRDLRLGKPTLYQLSYVRLSGWRGPWTAARPEPQGYLSPLTVASRDRSVLAHDPGRENSHERRRGQSKCRASHPQLVDWLARYGHPRRSASHLGQLQQVGCCRGRCYVLRRFAPLPLLATMNPGRQPHARSRGAPARSSRSAAARTRKPWTLGMSGSSR